MKSRKLLATVLGVACLGATLPAAAQAKAPAWQPVGATGPTVIPPVQSEVQKIFVDAEAGTFAVTARSLAAEGLGDVGSSIFGGGNATNLVTTSGVFSAGQRLEGFFVKPGTETTFRSGDTISFSPAPELGEKQVPLAAYDSPDITAPLPYNASAEQLQEELEDLVPIGEGNVEVSGGPGGAGANNPYVVAFKGDLADTNVGLLELGNGDLVGNAVAKTTTLGGRGTSILTLMAQNVGGATSSGTITLRATLPSGITALAQPTSYASGEGVSDWSCDSSTQSELLCTRDETVRPGLTVPPINTIITAAPGVTEGAVEIEILSDDGGASGTAELPLTVSTTPAGPGFQTFVAGAYDENGEFDQRAGGHPFTASTAIFANTVRTVKGHVLPAGEFKDITVKLPPGFLGNPSAIPACPESTSTQHCDLDSMVGLVEPIVERFGRWGVPAQVFNTQAPIGYPAKFRFRILESEDLNVIGSLRSDEDYGIDAASLRTPQADQVIGVFFTFWGEPASDAFNSLRCALGFDFGAIRKEKGCRPSGAKSTAFLTSATNCAEQAANPPTVPINTTIWQLPGQLFEKTFDIPPVTECENLKLEADFSFQPGTDDADSPASFTTRLAMPDEGLTDPSKLMTPSLKDSVVTLPEGVALNPSSADGLEACSFEEIGYKGNDFPMPNPIRFNKDPNQCPDASKIGTLELKSALLEETLEGALYLAEQGDDNPFGSLFAIYLVIENHRNGIFIKLPSRVDLDPEDGQTKATFTNLPQLPFTSLDLKLKGGDRSPLATPTTCGKYTTNATNTPWSAPESGPPLTSPSSFEINAGPNGLPCARRAAERPFAPGLRAGSVHPIAGATSPFQIQITRNDGHQELDRLQIAMPPGFVASLRGIPYCTEGQIASAAARDSGRAEQAQPSCPAASGIGSTNAGAGSGPRPFYAPGKLYLAGPYKGAPLSVVAITPAVAGPFDLGNVVVRSALRIDPRTARITAETDPLPRIIEGVPLRIRDLRINLDRPSWAQNPTNCEAMSVDVTAFGASGALARPSNRFQVGNCRALGFEPRLKLRLFGGIKRGKYQGLRAVVRPRPGDANISRTVVRMPRSAFLAQEHIRTVCTRVQFAAEACPKGAIYGRAIAWTPLLGQPLRGNVYLRSSDNELPDLVADLRGPAHQPIRIELVGRTDSVKGALRNTFDVVPDAPVSFFRLQLFGGKKGLIVNSRNICRGKNRAGVRMDAHNGRRHITRPRLLNRRCAILAKKRRKARRSAHRSRRDAWAKRRGRR